MKVFNKDKALKQIRLKQNKNTYIKRISIVLSCFILIIGIIMFTFAKFEQNSEEYTLINGVVKYGGNGDIQLSYVVDGVSQNTPPAKGTGYKLKTLDCTNATGRWDKNAWEITLGNLTGKAKCNLEFETTKEVEVTLYSAAEDEVYYYNNDEKVILGTTDSTGKLENIVLLPEDITIYSSIAKNPDNLNESYSKEITIDEDSEALYVMPDNTLYWYGYEKVQYNYVRSLDNSSYGNYTKKTNSYNLYAYKGSKSSNYHTGLVIYNKPIPSNVSSLKLYYTINVSPYNLWLGTNESYETTSANLSNKSDASSPNGIKTYDISLLNNTYPGVLLGGGTIDVHAVWLE